MVNFDLAIQHFKKVDLLLADITTKMLKNNNLPGTTSKTKPTAYVFHLYSSIISQQISTKAADKILERFLGLVGDPHDAANILKYDIDDLRSIGLSRQKASYIRSIAELTSNGTVKVDHLDALSDDEVVRELILIKGVGQWTAEMFLMFTLARPDIFSGGDLGLLNAAKKLYSKPDMTKQELLELSNKWSPHRTAAALVLWHSLDNKPTSV